MAKLQAAMTPVLPDGTDSPLVRPRGVTIASVLVLIAGVLFFLIGALSVTSAGSQAANYQTFYANAVAQCRNSSVGGIGTAVPTTVATPTAGPTTPLALTALPNTCRQITQPTLSESALSSYKRTLLGFSVVLIVIGIVTAASGWFLRDGRKWTRRALIAVVLLQLVLAFLFQVSNTITLLCTLLIVVGLSMTFLGRPAAYFMGVALRKGQKH